jgi:predicted permease
MGQEPQRVAVLSYQFWKRHFDGREDILGKSLQLAHKGYIIIGVLPPRFAWSLGDVYLPLNVTDDPKQPVWLSSVKLRVGVQRQASEAEFQGLLQDLARATPRQFPNSFRVRLDPFIDTGHGSLKRILYALFVAVAILLLVGCANASILFLARGVSRNRELALRTAVGATRSRIVRQLLTESIMIACVGAVFGIMLTYAGLVIVVKWLPWSYPREATIQVNFPVLVFGIGLVLFTGIVFGLWPSLRLSQVEPAHLLQANARTRAGGLQNGRTYGLLVASQVGLTLILLTAAGSTIRIFSSIAHIELGYNPKNTLVVGIPLHENSYAAWEKRTVYFDRLRGAVTEIPGVESVAISTMATPPASGLDEKVEILGQLGLEQKQTRLHLVSEEYFSVLGMQPLSGRIWDHAESMRGASVAVINQTMARRYLPTGDATGHALRMPELKNSPYQSAIPQLNGWFEIIGVVPDAKNDGLVNPVRPAVYVPFTVLMDTYTHILVHTRTSPASFFRAVRVQVHNVDSDQQVERESVSLEDVISQQEEWQQSELSTRLLVIFGILALALAAIGLYSVVSYSVTQRAKDIGIRMALGAQRRDILKSVLRSASMGVGAGVAVGAISILAMEKVLSSWVEVNPRDPVALASSIGVLLATAALACFVPARRASGVDPMDALRSE